MQNGIGQKDYNIFIFFEIYFVIELLIVNCEL